MMNLIQYQTIKTIADATGLDRDILGGCVLANSQVVVNAKYDDVNPIHVMNFKTALYMFAKHELGWKGWHGDESPWDAITPDAKSKRIFTSTPSTVSREMVEARMKEHTRILEGTEAEKEVARRYSGRHFGNPGVGKTYYGPRVPIKGNTVDLSELEPFNPEVGQDIPKSPLRSFLQKMKAKIGVFFQ